MLAGSYMSLFSDPHIAQFLVFGFLCYIWNETTSLSAAIASALSIELNRGRRKPHPISRLNSRLSTFDILARINSADVVLAISTLGVPRGMSVRTALDVMISYVS